MSVDTVINLAASGPGSLAATVAAAAAGDTIVFASYLAGGTIALANTLDLSKSLTIEGHIGGGYGTPNITLDGGGKLTDIVVDHGVVVSLDGLVIANGHGTGTQGAFQSVNGAGALAGGTGQATAGGILNHGYVTLGTINFVNDVATGGAGGFGASGYAGTSSIPANVAGGGGAGGDAAGAIYDGVDGRLVITVGAATFSGDTGTGGNGGTGGFGNGNFDINGANFGGAGGVGGANAIGHAAAAPTDPHGAPGGAPGQPGSPGSTYVTLDANGNAITMYGPGGGGGGGAGANTIGGFEAFASTGALIHQVTITGNPFSFAGATETGPFGSQALADVGFVGFTDGILAFDAHGGAAEVARLYGAALGRAPDALGVAYFTDQLNHGASLNSVAAAFTASPEFTAHYGAPTDAAFVGLLYQNVLGRAADMVGQGYWTSQLAAGHTRAEVTLGFSDSAENLANTAATTAAGIYVPDPLAVNVLRLDEALLGRGADAGGLQYWTAQQHAGASFDAVANAFAASPEYAAHYGTLTNTDFVTALYQNALGRGADAGGAAYWTGLLDAGTATRVAVAEGFATSAEASAHLTPLIAHGITFA